MHVTSKTQATKGKEVQKNSSETPALRTPILGATGTAISRIAKRDLAKRALPSAGGHASGVVSSIDRDNTGDRDKGGERRVVSGVSEGRRMANSLHGGSNSVGTLRADSLKNKNKQNSRTYPKLYEVEAIVLKESSLVRELSPSEFQSRRKRLWRKRADKDISMSGTSRHFSEAGIPFVMGNTSGSFAMTTESGGGNSTSQFMGCNYLFELATGSTAPAAGQVLYEIPILPSTFPGTAMIAMSQMFELCSFEALRLIYVPTCPVTTTGSLVTFFTPNPGFVARQKGAGINSLSMAYNSENFTEHQPFAPVEWDIGLPLPTPVIYTDQSTNDPSETCMGTLVFMCSGALPVSTSLGHFLIQYHCKAENKQYNFPDITTSSHGGLNVNINLTRDADSWFVLDTSVTLVGFSFPTVGENTILYCITLLTVTNTVAYYIEGEEESIVYNFAPGDVLWAVQTTGDGGAATYSFYGDRVSALRGPLVTDTTAINEIPVMPRGAIRFDVATAAAPLTFTSQGMAWVL